MAKKVTFLKDLPVSFKQLWLGLICLALIYSRGAYASPFNLDFFVTGQNLYVDDWISTGRQLYLSDCNSSAGRVFSFTSPLGFRLSGILVFFLKDNVTSPVSVLNPEDLKISLFEGSNFDLEKTLIFRSPFKGNSPSYNALAESFSLGLQQARGVFFELSPLWLNKNSIYTVVIECPGGTLPHKIYGDGKSSDVSNFDSTTLVSSTASNIRKPYFQLYAKNDGLANTVPAAKTPPVSRPVVFVHGLGGLPSDFADYLDLLKNNGWDSRYLLSFDYGLLGSGEYNNFAPVSDELSRMNLAVATLSATYKADGGDGKVNLVAYSSGSLLAKNFLGNYRAAHHVKNFISIAGAFKGSFLADLESGNDSFPRSASEVTASLAKVFLPTISSFNPLTYGRTPRDTVFRTKIVSTSSQVSSFKKEDLPSDIKYYNLQGDIKAANTQKLFKSLVKSEGSLGDGAVLGSSTADLPNPSSFSFLDSAVATRSVTKSSATVSAAFTLPDFSKIKFFHSSLLKAQEIKNKILELLK